MNTTHTPEPWHTFAFEVYNENEQIIADCGLSEDYWEKDGCQANAARIVACVNACAGMEDPAARISQMAYEADKAKEERNKAEAQRDDLIKQRVDLIIQRAALLEAIKSHVDLYNAGLLTDPQKLEEHTLRLAEIYTNIINS